MRLISAFVLWAAATSACASSFIASTDTLGASLANSVELSSDASSSLRDDKRIIAARDEAASFVATRGALRGARLEAALLLIRSTPHAQDYSDMALAEAILAR